MRLIALEAFSQILMTRRIGDFLSKLFDIQPPRNNKPILIIIRDL